MTALTDALTITGIPAGPWRHVVTVNLPEPPSANRWWRMGRGGPAGHHMHRSAEATAYTNAAKMLYGSAVGPGKAKGWPLCPKGVPVRVDITWFRKFRAGDLDKRVGILLDALQGLAYEKDSQISCIIAIRIEAPQAERASVQVKLYEIPTDIQQEL